MLRYSAEASLGKREEEFVRSDRLSLQPGQQGLNRRRRAIGVKKSSRSFACQSRRASVGRPFELGDVCRIESVDELHHRAARGRDETRDEDETANLLRRVFG